MRVPPTPGSGTRMVRLRVPSLVGRDRERALMQTRIDAVCGGAGVRVVVLTGLAGSGKSAIARAALSDVESSGRMERAATGYDLRGATTAMGLRHAVHRLLGAPHRSSDRPRWAWLRDTVGALPFDEEAMAGWLSDGSGDAVGVDRYPELALAALAAVARLRPVYLWLDDVGWSSDGALELVSRLLSSPSLPVLVVLTLRSGTAEHPAIAAALGAITSSERTTRIEVGPLDVATRRAVLRAAVELGAELADALAPALEDRPLLVLTRLYSWIDEERLVPSVDGYVLAPGVTVEDLVRARPLEDAVGARVSALVASFADNAQGAERAEGVLIAAALLGVAFEEPVLTEVDLGVDSGADSRVSARALVGNVLDRALLSGLVRSEGGSTVMRFDHGVVQEVLLSRLARHPSRVALLRGTARALATHHEMTRLGVAEHVARLLHEAGDTVPAVEAMLEATHVHARVGDFGRADDCIALGRAWLDEDDIARDAVVRGRVAMRAAERYYLASAYASSEALLDEAMAIFAAREEHDLLGAAKVLESGLMFYQLRFGEAECVARGVADDAAGTTPHVQHYAQHRLMQIYCLQGRLDDARRAGELALMFARRSGEGWRYRCSHVGLAETDMSAGFVRRGRARIGAVLRDAADAGDAMSLLEARTSSMWLLLIDARDEALERLTDALLEEVGVRGDPWRTTVIRAFRAASAAYHAPRETVAERVSAFAACFAISPHDDPCARYALFDLEHTLRRRVFDEEAAVVARLRHERNATLAQGFGDGAALWTPRPMRVPT